MHRPLWTSPLRRLSRPTICAGLAGIALGALLSTLARSTPAQLRTTRNLRQGLKAPIAEIMHCPLAFAGVHLLKDVPEHSKVAYHYANPSARRVRSVRPYDGTGPDARLIGIEYLVSDGHLSEDAAE